MYAHIKTPKPRNRKNLAMNKITQQNAAIASRKLFDTAVSLDEQIQQLVVDAFRKILKLGYPINVSDFSKHPKKKEIQIILKNLRAEIEALLVDACEAVIEQREELNGILAPLNIKDILDVEYNGSAIRDKCTEYTKRISDEIEMWFVIGIINKLSSKQLTDAFGAYLTHPYSNPYYTSTAKTNVTASAKKLLKMPPNNAGGYQSSINSLKRLGRIAIGSSARQADNIAYEKAGVIGFYVFRGSSYPCSHCDSMVGFHLLEFATLPPYHPYCYCYAVPVQ